MKRNITNIAVMNFTYEYFSRLTWAQTWCTKECQGVLSFLNLATRSQSNYFLISLKTQLENKQRRKQIIGIINPNGSKKFIG